MNEEKLQEELIQLILDRIDETTLQEKDSYIEEYDNLLHCYIDGEHYYFQITLTRTCPIPGPQTLQ